jgi:hypothetical protein
MSVQLSTSKREAFASGDWLAGTGDEYRAEASTYIAYAGRFDVAPIVRSGQQVHARLLWRRAGSSAAPRDGGS